MRTRPSVLASRPVPGILASLTLLLSLTGCAAPANSGQPLTDLDAALTPLRTWFDVHANQPRALLILSPV